MGWTRGASLQVCMSSAHMCSCSSSSCLQQARGGLGELGWRWGTEGQSSDVSLDSEQSSLYGQEVSGAVGGTGHTTGPGQEGNETPASAGRGVCVSVIRRKEQDSPRVWEMGVICEQ